MNIRTKLTVTFFCIVIVIVSVISASIYYFSAHYREHDFYRRLKNRAINAAKLLMEFEEVDADLLQRMEKDNPASLPDQYIIIYNYKNEILYSAEANQLIPIDTTLLNKIRLQNEIRYRYKKYEVLGFLFTDKYDRFTVIAAATDVYGLDALKNLRSILFVTFGFSIVFVSMLGWIYSGKVLRPISKIVNDVDNITEVSLDQRLDEGRRKDELGKLAQTFNRMLSRLQTAFFAQKNFITNASHEIKTPITVLSGEIEVTLLQPRTNEYYIKVLRSVLDGIKGLNKLSTQLLLLAQTSADHPEKRFTPIRIDDILWAVKEELTKVHPHYKIDILFNLTLNHDLLVIEGDEELLKVLVMNLMDNACKYSENHQVIVTLKSDEKTNIILDFSNSGIGIVHEDLEKIFAPFFRGKQHKKVKGFGIGLPLAKKIVELHSGKIAVESTPHKKTQFIITLPIEK
jgi:signal transduction histidine kinase